jgi:hypothetical protein
MFGRKKLIDLLLNKIFPHKDKLELEGINMNVEKDFEKIIRENIKK